MERPNAVRAVLTMTVPRDSADAFEKEWACVADWVRRQHGCLRQALCRRTGAAETTYVITSDWSDRATYHRFETSERQDGATAGLRALRTSVHMDVLDVLEHLDPAAPTEHAEHTGPADAAGPGGHKEDS